MTDRPGAIVGWHMPGVRPCAHCGQICGDCEGGYAAIPAGLTHVAVCHPNAPGRPDCYRRVTIYAERLGALIGVNPKPAGVDAIIGEPGTTKGG